MFWPPRWESMLRALLGAVGVFRERDYLKTKINT